jgi:DNA invertase Pin-like site-specific DNA recombinase
MTQNCILYSRFSSHEQAQGHSVERQRTNGREYIEAQGWTLESVISDEALSAFKGANREEGAQLHKFEFEARNGLHRGKALVVENIDRLSRQGAKAAAQLIWSLNENGVDVATWHDGYVYACPYGRKANEQLASKLRRPVEISGQQATALKSGR